MFIFLLILLLVFWPPPKILAAPPAGIQTLNLVTEGLVAPTSLGIAPDGRIFILEQGGAVKIYKNGRLLERVFDELPVASSGEKGLLGVAFDPDFTSNHWVYFHFVDSSNFHRIVRHDAATDFAAAAPVNIWKSPQSTINLIHKGGSLEFGPDGKLYVAIGDDGNGLHAQDLSVPFGKILRINKDGTVPADNPFYGQSGKLGEIYAYGFRNPFRFQFDSTTGQIYEGDVGEAAVEEVNRVTAGSNYGWPACEGSCSVAGAINPIYTYNHDGSGASITGGLIYRGSMFPPEYVGNYFFGDYVRGDIYRLTFDSGGTVASKFDFDLEAESSTDFREALDGSIYYLTIVPPALKRIVYNNGNQYPAVFASASVTSGLSPLSVNFSSAGSSDPEGQPLSFLWNFGDGSTSTVANPSHTYSADGQYSAILTVSDGVHQNTSIPIYIEVGTPPTITINSPGDNSKYNAGDSINYSAASNGTLSTEILFHHNTHTHPFIRPAPGGSGFFQIPATGESATDVWYEIIFTATGAAGLTSEKSVNIYPNLSSFQLATDPPGLKILVNGVPTDTGSIGSVVGFKNDLDVSSQTLNGIQYEFDHWGDFAAKSRTITTSSTPATYTSFFRSVPAFTTQFFNNTTLSGTPILSRTDPEINYFWGSGSPGPGVNSDQFSARFQKSQTFSAGRYTFTAGSDDGLRLYVDNTLVIDKWLDRGYTTDTASINLSSGNHTIKLEYYENGGDASVFLKWDFTPLTSDDTYRIDYFSNPNLSGDSAFSVDESAFFHDWGSGSPAAAIPVDNFSARAVRTVEFSPGWYRFLITADDGVRFYIDNKLILDKWIDQPPTRYTLDLNLSGLHTIKMEYYEKGGGAVARLSYLPASPPPSDSYLVEFYPNSTLTGVPVLVRYDNQIAYNLGNNSPDPSVPADRYSARWTKNIILESGTYRFNVVTDDGLKIFLDNQKIFDQWRDQPPTGYVFDLPISSGPHRLMIEYYENAGFSFASVNYLKL